MGKNQHVVSNKENKDWGVRGEKNLRMEHFNTQKEAIHRAIEIAKNQKSEVVIHGRNGRIRDKDSYGNDPFPPRDTVN